MITKNQAEQILIDNIKCDTVIRDLLKEVPGQNNVVTQNFQMAISFSMLVIHGGCSVPHMLMKELMIGTPLTLSL
jgi:GTPase Era involved in 16S rRNA processing